MNVLMFCVILTSTGGAKLTTYRGYEVSREHLSAVFSKVLEPITSAIECAAVCSERNCTSFGHCEDDNSCMFGKKYPGSTVYGSTAAPGYPYSSTQICHVYWENGFVPEIDETVCPKADCDQRKKDVIFVIDESQDVSDDDFSHEKQFISDVIDKYNLSSDAIRMAVAGFNNKANTRIYLSEYTDTLAAQQYVASFTRGSVGTQSFVHNALNSLKNDILKANNGDRASVDNVVVLIIASSGSNSQAVQSAVDNLHKSTGNTELFVIDITTRTDAEIVQYIASDPDVDHIFKLNNFDKLNTIKKIAAKFTYDPCDPPCLNNTPCNRRRNLCE